MEKFDQAPSQEKQGIWKKIQKYSEVAALAALVSFASAESSAAPEDAAVKRGVEHSVEKAANHADRVAGMLKEKGQAGAMNGTPVRRWVSPDKASTVVVGYSEGEKKAEWLMYEGAGATMRFFDKGADGSIDRVVMNKETASGTSEKSAFNDLKTFGAIENLAEEAQVTSGLEPEDVKVYEVLSVEGSRVIRVVDFQTGEASELVGQEAESLFLVVQGKYAGLVQEVDKQTASFVAKGN